MTPDGMSLTAAEALALARRLAAGLLADWRDHITWEDVPGLTEEAWESVASALDTLAALETLEANRLDKSYGIDSHELLERAT